MVAVLGTVALTGLEPTPVRVEAVLAGGLPGFRLVGLPDTTMREAGDRIDAAVKRSGFDWIDSKLVVNLAPAGVRKTGAGFDLPIALALLAATKQLHPRTLTDVHAIGELGLDGTVRPVPGVLPVATAIRDLGGKRLVVADRAAVEASLVEGLEVVPVANLREAVEVLAGREAARPAPAPRPVTSDPVPDLRDVRGQPMARRALEIAAAGGHHLLLAGPPGCGKSMLARRLPSILPLLRLEEALEVAAVHSVAGVRPPDAPLSCTPPFRDPHPGTSMAGLVGGGSGTGRPGQLSLAHRGVLFLDEMLEMPRHVLDALRQPLEHGAVTIVRSRGAVRFPARVLLVAATNPCPCGHLGDPARPCRCRPDQVERYRSRLSGPLLDRLDIHVELPPVDQAALLGPPDGDDSETVGARVAAARQIAATRWRPGALVRDATPAEVRSYAEPAAVRAAARAVESLHLSARAFDRILRVARTIADLEAVELTCSDHVDEAVAYRLASPVTAP